MQLYSPTHWMWKGAVSNFLRLCPKNFWAPGRRDVCISKKSSFFSVFAGQKHIGRATSDTFLDYVHQHLSEQKQYNKRFFYPVPNTLTKVTIRCLWNQWWTLQIWFCSKNVQLFLAGFSNRYPRKNSSLKKSSLTSNWSGTGYCHFFVFLTPTE